MVWHQTVNEEISSGSGALKLQRFDDRLRYLRIVEDGATVQGGRGDVPDRAISRVVLKIEAEACTSRHGKTIFEDFFRQLLKFQLERLVIALRAILKFGSMRKDVDIGAPHGRVLVRPDPGPRRPRCSPLLYPLRPVPIRC